MKSYLQDLVREHRQSKTNEHFVEHLNYPLKMSQIECNLFGYMGCKIVIR